MLTMVTLLPRYSRTRFSTTIAVASANSLTASSSHHRITRHDSAASNTDPPHGGPADTHVTEWIERQANAFIADGLRGVARVPFECARSASTVHAHQYLDAYVPDLPSVIDLQAIRESKVRTGVDPLGGASGVPSATARDSIWRS